jgi:hypothetical protein
MTDVIDTSLRDQPIDPGEMSEDDDALRRDMDEEREIT